MGPKKVCFGVLRAVVSRHWRAPAPSVPGGINAGKFPECDDAAVGHYPIAPWGKTRGDLSINRAGESRDRDPPSWRSTEQMKCSRGTRLVKASAMLSSDDLASSGDKGDDKATCYA
jgi:hypothetical protein